MFKKKLAEEIDKNLKEVRCEEELKELQPIVDFLKRMCYSIELYTQELTEKSILKLYDRTKSNDLCNKIFDKVFNHVFAKAADETKKENEK